MIIIDQFGNTYTAPVGASQLDFTEPQMQLGDGINHISMPFSLYFTCITGDIGVAVLSKNDPAPTMTDSTLFTPIPLGNPISDVIPPFTFNPRFQYVYVKSSAGGSFNLNV
jgi:hypothetical protein